jgi:hypothetical protein
MSEESAKPVIVDVDVGTDQSSEVPDPAPIIVVHNEPEPEPEPEPAPIAVVPNPMETVDNRFHTLEQRMDAAENRLVEHDTAIAGRAESEHSHPVPSELAALNDHLTDIVREEVAPRKEHWWDKKLWGT